MLAPTIISNRYSVCYKSTSWEACRTILYFGTASIVSVYLGEMGFTYAGYIKMYENIGGELSALPIWVSAEDFFTFSCVLVDLNLDGYLDLAVSTGEAYDNLYSNNYVFYNQNGSLETTPSWQNQVQDASYDVSYADFDKNGYPDLVFVNSMAANLIFFNYETGLNSIPGWIAADSVNNANSVAISDFNNDGYIDVAVSDNRQMQNTATFKIYYNNNGEIELLPPGQQMVIITVQELKQLI